MMGQMKALLYKNYVLAKNDFWWCLIVCAILPAGLLISACVITWIISHVGTKLDPTTYVEPVYNPSDGSVAGVFGFLFYERYVSFLRMTGQVDRFQTREALDSHLLGALR